MARLPNAEESVDAAVAAHPDKFCGGFFFDPLQPDPAGRAERAFDEMRFKLGLPSSFDLRLAKLLEVHNPATELRYVNIITPHFGAGFWRETLMAADLCDNIYIEIDPAGTFPLLLSCFLLRI